MGVRPEDRGVDQGHDLGVRLARGDDDALEECYALYGSSVLAYLRRLVGRDEAEDVLHQLRMTSYVRVPSSWAGGMNQIWAF